DRELLCADGSVDAASQALAQREAGAALGRGGVAGRGERLPSHSRPRTPRRTHRRSEPTPKQSCHPRQSRVMNLSTNRFSTIVGTFSIVVAYFYLSTFWQDISFWDESIFYLHGSRSFSFASFLFGAEYGPLYLAWYKTLGFFAEDPVLLY